MMQRNNCRVIAAMIAIAMVALLLLAAAPGAAIRFQARLVNGKPRIGIDGNFLGYYIFAEERAVITPTPEFEIWDLVTNSRRVLAAPPFVAVGANPPTPRNNTALDTRTHTQSRSKSLARLRYSSLRWTLRKAPLGALNLKGPRSWISNGPVKHTFSLDKWVFQSAGEYSVGFNASFYNGGHFQFNWTVHVNRQPAFLANGPSPFGYNGTRLSIAPQGHVQSILGLPVATSTVNVSLEFQAYPAGATWSGVFSMFTSNAGVASFNDVTVTQPGAYTYRLLARLSDGSTIAAPSVQVNVERALPTVITRLASGDGIARFHMYEVLKFVINDVLGRDYDPRLNMTMRLGTNTPTFYYEGLDTVAGLLGQASVKQSAVVPGYTFEFPGMSIDLPGTFEIVAAIALPDGSTLERRFVSTIRETPTFEVPSPLSQNKLGVLTIFGPRPKYADMLLMLSDREDCTNQQSDMIVWPRERNTFQTSRNFSIVPWLAGAMYVCLKVPSQPTFGPLIQHYLPQFDEAYPLIKALRVGGVAECAALTSLEAARYRSLGWDSAEGLRRYGCALAPPVSGTIAPCGCPSHLSCGELRHATFTPPNLNIGACQCCAGWIMAVASVIIASVFAGILYIVYAYV